MKLNKNNYFSLTNKYISNSKITDFKKDRNFFINRHLTGNITKETTDPMIIGSAVDAWITQGEKVFREKYIMVSQRSRKDPNWEYQLNPTMYNAVEKMCRRVEFQDAYKKLKGYKRQVILQHDMPLGQFVGICGMLDFLKIKDGVANIIDLKTATSINPKKYLFHCFEYNYFRAAAMYKTLVELNYPEVKQINVGHLVMEKDTDEIYTCQTFWLAPDRIIEEQKNITVVLEEIKNETKWLPNNTSWDKAIEIGALTEEF